MAEKLNSVIAVIGIDNGKNSFHIIGLDGRGAIALRRIGMEAPVGAHHLSRRRRLLGHDARLSDSGAHSHIDADKRSPSPPG